MQGQGEANLPGGEEGLVLDAFHVLGFRVSCFRV